MIIFEMGRPFQPKPGLFKDRNERRIFLRVWWLWFAVAYCSYSLKEFHDDAAKGKTGWKSQ